MLGSNPSRLVFEDRLGAEFRYFKEPKDGYHGKMVEMRDPVNHFRSRGC
jgi:hypothetical protein